MTEYRKGAASPVAHVATKWDEFKLEKTEHSYKCQKGSGRQVCFDQARDGMTVKDWAKKCAEIGFDSRFVTGSLMKLQGAKSPGWKISEKNADGKTVEEVKKQRDEDPEKAKAREEKAAAKAKAKQEREEKKAAKAKADKAAKAKAAKAKAA